MAWGQRTFKFKKKPGTQLRSGLEDVVDAQLRSHKVKYEYESKRIPYTVPTYYLADFVLSNGIIIECKGWFPTEERRKFRLIKEQNPDLDIRFIFSNSSTKIGKGSKTSYGDWARLHGFPYADGLIPTEWLS